MPPSSPLISATADTRAMQVDLVHGLIDEGRFHAALSYFTTRSLPPWRLQELHEVLQACVQSLLLEGRMLAVELLTESELALIESVDIADPEWVEFVDWVASDYGTSNLGPILYPLPFRSDQASAFLTSTLQQDCSLKDILALLCISQITQCAPPELTDVALALAGNPRLKMFSLRCLSEWVALMRRQDQELVVGLIRRVLLAATDRNEFLAAAYILEQLSAPPASRYQLALAAIEQADAGGLDSHVSDHFHVYILRHLSRQQLTELKNFASSPRLPSNLFRESLQLCLDAWLHIREQDPVTAASGPPAPGFSAYLAALTQRLFAEGSGTVQPVSALPLSLTQRQIDQLRALCQGDAAVPQAEIEAVLTALAADTARLDLA